MLICTGKYCKLRCGAESCKGMRFRCPAGATCDVESASELGPVIVSLERATQGAVRASLPPAVESKVQIVDGVHDSSCDSTQWRCPSQDGGQGKCESHSLSDRSACTSNPACPPAAAGQHDISEETLSSHEIPTIIFTESEREQLAATALQPMAIQMLGGLCVLTGHVQYSDIKSGMLRLPGRVTLGEVPAACVPSCCMSLFNGAATAELCGDGTLKLLSTMVSEGQNINLNGIAWSPRRINNSSLTIKSGGLFGAPFMEPHANILDAGDGSPRLCALGGVLRWDASQLRKGAAVALTVLPEGCRVGTARSLMANLQWRNAAGVWTHDWSVLNRLTLDSDGSLTLTMGGEPTSQATSARVSFDGIVLVTASSSSGRSLGADGEWQLEGLGWQCQSETRSGCSLDLRSLEMKACRFPHPTEPGPQSDRHFSLAFIILWGLCPTRYHPQTVCLECRWGWSSHHCCDAAERWGKTCQQQGEVAALFSCGLL